MVGYSSGMDGIGYLLLIGAISLCVSFIFVIHTCYSYIDQKINGKTIESKMIVKPDYRLETNGKNIDTIYVYKFE
jgi:hypothetical protein